MRSWTNWRRRWHERIARQPRSLRGLPAAPARQGHRVERAGRRLRGDAAARFPARPVAVSPGRKGWFRSSAARRSRARTCRRRHRRARPAAGNRVLEIGTGSGFTAAVMARLGGRVVTLDRYKTLVEQARQRFEKLGLDQRLGRARPTAATGCRARGRSIASSPGRPSTACRVRSSTSCRAAAS